MKTLRITSSWLQFLPSRLPPRCHSGAPAVWIYQYKSFYPVIILLFEVVNIYMVLAILGYFVV